MNRNHVMIGLIAICLIIIVFVLFGGSGDKHVEDALKQGLRSNVACANEACQWTSSDYRAHADDADWPKECPDCKDKTLYKASICPWCEKMTYMKRAEDNGIYCQHCKGMLVDPNAPKFAY